MRVTEKGQGTIPKPIRDSLGIGPGSEVEFILRNGEVVVEARSTGSEASEIALMRHVDRHAGSFNFDDMQADDVMRWLRD